MATTQLDTENADRDLTSTITVLTHTPDILNPITCYALVFVGDGAKDLDGTGGSFELTLSVDGVIYDGVAQTKTVTAGVTRLVWLTIPFAVPKGEQVLLRVKSPNAGDTDVDVTAYLFDGGYAPLAEFAIMTML